MTDNPTGPELFEDSANHLYDLANPPSIDQDNGLYAQIAQVNAINAQTAAIVMLTEVVAAATGTDHYDLDAWRKVVPPAPLTERKSKNRRRPECAKRHTEDCDYADPEPKHELLPVGTRVLVSERERKNDGWIRYYNPVAGRISGYDMHKTKYRWQVEFGPGSYASHDYWAFVDNRVTVHPDGPECPPPPQPVKQEPTGPRIYVENLRGKQGHIVDTAKADTDDNDTVKVKVRWYAPGASPVWVPLDLLNIIPAEEVDRCPNGQTGEECGLGENQCELCLKAEDAEAEVIERSMGLR